jgi:hypothetical protein
MRTPINYEELNPLELCQIIEGLREVESDGLRKTKAEQSYIVRNISSAKLVEVSRLLKERKSLTSGVTAVLSGEVR